MTLIGIDASRASSTAPTGTESYSYHLIRALLPLLGKYESVRLYCREQPTAEAFPGAELRVIPFPRLWTHIRLSWEMLRDPPKVLFVPAHVLPPIHPRRTLVTVHDLGYRSFPEAHPWSQRLYLEASTRWNARVSSHILADSMATRQALVESYGISPDKITVVYPGYETDLHRIEDPETLAQVHMRYGLDRPYILFLGRIQPRKNLARLIAAFGNVLKRHPELLLVLAGPPGWFAETIRTRARELGLERHVVFPGYIAMEDKAALLSGARLFAFPSLYEGFGFPVLEAQACGVPVLTATTSSLPEVAGEGALLVDPLDTEAIEAGLSRLLEEPALRQTLIAHGTRNLVRFSWEQAAQQTAAILRQLAT
ncbi:MAG: glycosyltransferase family 4 protein [Anaerolineae bacterium]|nr:glycosyltransferase family 4 protein [Anaerolineae bacterium]